MFVSNLCVRTGRILSLIDWEEVSKIVFHGLIALMVGIWVAGETLGSWLHRTNDWLAHHWVRLIVTPTPVMEEEENEEDEEIPLPAPLEDPWASPIEIELMLALALEPLAILFTTPLLLAAAQAPVALLAAGQDVVQQTPPAATNGRRKRGRRAHTSRNRQPA